MIDLYRWVRWIKAHLLKQASMAHGFGQPAVHEKMLLDTARCEAYREAIRRCVRPGDVVVDLGAGTGLLSFFAVEAGAARVYAIEMSRIADVLEQVSRANGMQERIRVMRGNSRRLSLPERCDVLVTETLSDLGFENENIVEYVNDVRRRMLKPDARVVPTSCRVLFVPIETEAFGPGRLPDRLYGLDYTPLRRARYGVNTPVLVRGNGKPVTELAAPVEAWSLDLQRELPVPGAASVEFAVSRAGRFDGMLGWFDATLAPGVRLGNGHHDPEGSWAQVFFPVIEQPRLQPGDVVRFQALPRIVAGECEWSCRVEVRTASGQAAVVAGAG